MRYSNSPLHFITDAVYDHKRIAKLLALLLLIFALFLCWKIGSSSSQIRADHSNYLENIDSALAHFPYLAVSDADRATDGDEIIDVDLSTYEEDCIINSAGTYRLSGSLSGCVHVYADEQYVHIILDGVDIESAKGPAFNCGKAAKLIVTLAPGSENIISDSGKYSAYDEAEACFYSDCDLTINGTGSLTVNAYYKDAIRSKDILKLLNGNYSVKCKRTAFHGNDGLVVEGGNYMISTEKYGLRTANSGIDGRGNLIVGGGVFSIIAGRYSFMTERADLYVFDCDIQNKSVVDVSSVGGTQYVQVGCIK